MLENGFFRINAVILVTRSRRVGLDDLDAGSSKQHAGSDWREMERRRSLDY